MQDGESAWRALQSEFIFDSRLIPMNAANMCPPPRSVISAVEAANRSVDADVSFHNRARYNALRETVRTAVARFLDGDADEFAIIRNASEGNNIVVAGLSLAAGDEVLVTDQNHPSNGLAWEAQAARRGFTVTRVALPANPSGGDELAAAVARAITARTRVLAFSDVSNSSGMRLPAAELCRVGRERGIHVHVDGAQSMGAMRLSMRELGAGSYTASTQKWLMGPREGGVLFVRKDLIPGIQPAVISRGFSDPADPGPLSAKKLDMLGQRNEGVMAGFGAAIAFVERIGIEKIQARVEALAAHLIAGLRNIPGYRLVTPSAPGCSLGVVVGRFEGLDHQKLHDRLYHGHGVASAPTGGLRLCAHVYNTLADVDRAIRAVAAAKGEV
jgi:selenocysteine lyase/cysteine desulfurase